MATERATTDHHDPRREEAALEPFAGLESRVRSYSRAFPERFHRARGAEMFSADGRRFLDFFAGAGALNYGHNNPRLKERLQAYLADDGITHSLDMATEAKGEFLRRFQDVVLGPRGLDYRVQFTGPTGTNAVEAALKLARKVTGRTAVAHFANSFHGVTLGSLAVTGNGHHRRAAGVPLEHALSLPYDGDLGPGVDTLEVLRAALENPGSGVEPPAAVIVETVQAEGGVKVAGEGWLRRLAELLRRHEILLIVDDIQVGCGRTGPFFSFERAGLRPDLVCLSKSISGLGLPMALVLIAPHLDRWEPGEHIGTFRGNNLAFVTATEALSYWCDDDLERRVASKGERVRTALQGLLAEVPEIEGRWRGLGLIQGVETARPEVAAATAREAFRRGLVIETAGPRGEVVKLLPPLLIEDDELDEGLALLADSFRAAVAETSPAGV